jgi:uncharacterized protein (TIGR02145 family)
MKKFSKLVAVLTLGFTLLLSCSKSDAPSTNSSEVPTLSTTATSSLTTTTANCGGNISSIGTSPVTVRGVVWSTTTNPTIALTTKTNDGTGTGTFMSAITGLVAGTTYYVRAYATNNAGTAYGNELSFATTTAVNLQGVTICTQVWKTKNLDVSTYSDGTPIPQVTDPSDWSALTTGAWCYYNNATDMGTIYGKLYNWYAVAGIYDAASAANPALRKNLAPTGWHVPTDAEWTSLTTCLGGISLAGGKMKETGTAHWNSPNTGADNSSGFTGLANGYRNYTGTFYNLGGYGNWWSLSEYGSAEALCLSLKYDGGNSTRGHDLKQSAFSVRCLKD